MTLPPVEDNTGRWENQPDGSWRFYPKQKSLSSSGPGVHDHGGVYLGADDLVEGANINLDKTSQPGKVIVAAEAGDGVVDHGELTGLAGDDHPHYLTNERGDLRYEQLGHTHPTPPTSLPPGGDTGDFLIKASAAEGDGTWAPVTPGAPGLATRYGYYRHYTTDQSYPRGSWQTVKIGLTNNAYSSPKNNPQLHQFQISMSSPNASKPRWCQFQYWQVQENDGTGPSSAMPWYGENQSFHWSHLFEHQGSTVQIRFIAEGSGTVVINYVILKYISFLAP